MSRSLYTMSADIRASGRKAGAGEEAKQQRFYLMAGGQYLHWSGDFLTVNREHAWEDTMEKAVNCRRVHPAAAGCRTHPIISIPKHVQEPA